MGLADFYFTIPIVRIKHFSRWQTTKLSNYESGFKGTVVKLKSSYLEMVVHC